MFPNLFSKVFVNVFHTTWHWLIHLMILRCQNSKNPIDDNKGIILNHEYCIKHKISIKSQIPQLFSHILIQFVLYR